MTTAKSTTIVRGLLAGAVGVTALNLVSYLDMAVRGRPASTVPENLVDTLASRAGHPIPGDGQSRGARRTALGALSGIGTGAAVGVVMSAAKSAGWRASPAAEALAGGALAMATSDVPAALLGVTQPARWAGKDWLSDAIPHLAYGLAAQRTLSALDDAGGGVPAEPVAAGTVIRSGLLGLATGCRSSLGFIGPRLGTAPDAWRAPMATLMGAEIVLDKLPKTPSRTQPPGLTARLASGAVGSRQLARNSSQSTSLPMLVGVAGSAIGSFAGLAWRDWAGQRMPKWCAAVAEDAVALSATYVACRPQSSTAA